MPIFVINRPKWLSVLNLSICRTKSLLKQIEGIDRFFFTTFDVTVYLIYNFIKFVLLTWNTVTVAHKILLKCFLSHSQYGCLLMISGQVHSLSCPSSSVNLQNLPPKRYMPRMLQNVYYLILCNEKHVTILLLINYYFWLINSYFLGSM